MLGFSKLAKKIFGSSNERYIKSLQPKVDAINALEPECKRMSDDELKAKTVEFRERLTKGETVDDLLIEAFAVVREASVRVLGQRHYNVQLIGGMVLNDCGISEMKTGEGKTLVATLAAYLNALPGKGCHVVTVNDYLAPRDAEWMGRIYGFLGLTTGVIIPSINEEERREAYACDITYGTNNEFGFDYLRDNMKYRPEQLVQREFHFAVVDEVDSILVDEARTPLIISGPTEDKTDLYVSIDKVVMGLDPEDYEKDEKTKNVGLTEDGTEKVEGLLQAADLMTTDNLYDYENISLVHHVDQALKARTMFVLDEDYIIKDGKVVIIDEFTGRMMDGRRYSGGLHQAIEAKENVEIMPENVTLASITFQNYFRMYPKLSGMTGTASTEAEEFGDIYGLSVVEIPTNLPIDRFDDHDEFYRTAAEKYTAIIADIRECQERGQPVLVGTVSIEKSEHLAELLTKEKIKHQVLNARFHEQEAFIVSQAGVSGSITIATNMAGRGTDIQLGGNADMLIALECSEMEEGAERTAKEEAIRAKVEVEKQKTIDAGGLYVMATERHESRRIDNQLRGRSGRQGDPGKSKFYLSLQDDLMRIFGPERMDGMLVRLGIEEGEAISHPWINKAIEKAQRKVEARNYDTRKNLVKYDDVMNNQRKVIYDQRREIMSSEDVAEIVKDMRIDTIENMVAAHIPPKAYPDQWDMEGLDIEVKKVLDIDAPVIEWSKEDGVDESVVTDRLINLADRSMAEKAVRYGTDVWRNVEKSLLLQVIDQEWQDHLSNLDYLKQATSLRGYGQRDPLNEYKAEAFTMFEQMLDKSRESTTTFLSQVELSSPEEGEFEPQARETVERHIDPATGQNAADPNDTSTWGNVSRNAPCPCGSGQKFKHCHGSVESAGGAVQSGNPFEGVGRNDKCPCGSGKKFKHCHGAI